MIKYITLTLLILNTVLSFSILSRMHDITIKEDVISEVIPSGEVVLSEDW